MNATDLATFFTNNQIDLTNETILVAVSAGPDSMALLSLLLELKQQTEKIKQDKKAQQNKQTDNQSAFKIIAAHVDHCLRDDSLEESELLQSFAKSNDFELVETKWLPELHPKTGVEAAAREFRYDFFARVAQENNANYLLTAHHGDDLLENILIKLVRSGNVAEMNSLKPIRLWHDKLLLRPLLGFQKAELESYCLGNNIPFIIDTTNQEDFTIRNRMRNHVVPLLKQENDQITKNADKFSQQLNEQNQVLNELSQASVELEPLLSCKAWRGELAGLARFSQETMVSIIQQDFSRLFNKTVEQTPEFKAFDFEKNNALDLNLGLQLVTYQKYFYLLDKSLFADVVGSTTAEIANKQTEVELNKVFDYQQRLFVISDNAELANTSSFANQLVLPNGTFFADQTNKFFVGPINSETKLKLANGQSQLPKKKFAEAGIPSALRPYLLAIYNSKLASNNSPIYLEKTYQNQAFSSEYQKYYVFELLKNTKEK